MAHYNVTQEDLEKAGGYVEPGTYPARIVAIRDKASAKGNPVMWVDWVVTGTEPPAGSKISEPVTMTPEAFFRLDELFQAIGFRAEGTGFESNDLINGECKLVLVDDTYEGKKRTKVKSHLPLNV